MNYFRYDCDTPDQSQAALLELDFMKMTNSKYAVAMNSCSSTLLTALKAIGVTQGDLIAMPAFTFVAVPSAIVNAGGTPILVNIDENFVIDVNDLELTFKTFNIKALLLSYMRGRVPDLDIVIELCSKYGVILIEDAAHALGVKWRGRQVGTFGAAGCFSMQSSKMLDGGEGGILITNDDMIALKSIAFSGCFEQHWKKHFLTIDDQRTIKSFLKTIPIFNFRMSNLTASIIRPQISDIDNRIQKYDDIYQELIKIISENENIRIPVTHEHVTMVHDSAQFSVPALSDIQLTAALSNINSNNIKLERFNNDNARCFWNWNFFENLRNCEETERIIFKSFDIKFKHNFQKRDIMILSNVIKDAFR